MVERGAGASAESRDIVLGAGPSAGHRGAHVQGMMGRVVGGAARGTVDHGGRGHRLARMVLAGRDAGRRAGYRGQGELLHTGMRESISRGDFAEM